MFLSAQQQVAGTSRQAELSWPKPVGQHPGNMDKELLPQAAQLQLFLNSEVTELYFVM